jgi:hypothetical protein
MKVPLNYKPTDNNTGTTLLTSAKLCAYTPPKPFINITRADYITWCKADLWTIERAILLLLNAETLPSREPLYGVCKSADEQVIYDNFIKIWAIAEGSLKTGVLKKIGKSYPSLLSEVFPGDFVQWAKSKDYHIPDELIPLAKTKPTESEKQAEVIMDDELGAVWDALPTILNELNQRIEAPYDGVLGCPPDSVTKDEKERFVSIRNQLLDGECFTKADIHGLIDDCNANSNSFSRIPDRLKQDIRFLASLWHATKKNEPQTKVVDDAGTGIDATKPRKRLKPLERETNEGLLLLYEIFNYYKVEYLDDLGAHKAWGKIISKEFCSDYIDSIADTKKYIMLSGGEKLSKTDFSDKYRRRFE